MVSDKWQVFRGIISAVVTPMHADESVNYSALDALARAQLARGVEGFYCCGSSGEGPLLRFDERRQVLATLVQSAGGRVPVIAHVGTPRTRDAVELAKHAEQDGASAVSLVPPYYYKYSREEIIAYYRRVLDAISIPVILYNIPQFTGVELDAQSADALLGDEQVLGVKHTSHNLYSLERMIARYPEKVFFNGFDEIFLSSLAAGATATVGTTVNLQPELFLALRFSAGRHCPGAAPAAADQRGGGAAGRARRVPVGEVSCRERDRRYRPHPRAVCGADGGAERRAG